MKPKEREEREFMENHFEVEEQDKGFTLVELLIVIVILGILATVTVFAVTGITNRGKTSACDSDKKVLQTAEEAYAANHGNYAATQNLLLSDGLIHETSGNYTITVVAAGAALPGPDGVLGNADDTVAGVGGGYYLTGAAGTDCASFHG
jgi:prepilin-type N-terminal cleavage/methylation domain-containing protein